LRGKIRGELRASSRATRKKSDVVNADIPEVLVTGCRDTQTSADAYIAGSYNGALTYNLVAAIKEAKGKVSYADLHAKTVAKLKAGKFSQVPQLEGRKSNFANPFLAPLA
jgi:hypothetical protein